jgi:hypothetical protein
MLLLLAAKWQSFLNYRLRGDPLVSILLAEEIIVLERGRHSLMLKIILVNGHNCFKWKIGEQSVSDAMLLIICLHQ